MAVVPALQGLSLGLDLAFPGAHGNLEVVRINTKIIVARLKKQAHTQKKREHANGHDRCNEMESKCTSLYTLDREGDGEGEL